MTASCRSGLPRGDLTDHRLELVAVPVSDIDRAKAFYVEQVGFNADHDHSPTDDIRFVQLTPPGSACSIAIGHGLVEAVPGSAKGLQLVVDDAQAAHDDLASRGVAVSGEAASGTRFSSRAATPSSS